MSSPEHDLSASIVVAHNDNAGSTLRQSNMEPEEGSVEASAIFKEGSMFVWQTVMI